jgi:hypothetical protein
MTGSFKMSLLIAAAVAAVGAGVYLLVLKRTVPQEALDAQAMIPTGA